MKNFTRRQSLRIALAAVAVPLLVTGAHAAGHAKKHTVQIEGFKFSPANMTINAGDTVEFVNMDGAPHTATADSGSFDTGRLGKGQSKAIKFADKGTVEYFCGVHPHMRAKIVVK